jgi:hypothetical protein
MHAIEFRQDLVVPKEAYPDYPARCFCCYLQRIYNEKFVPGAT